MPAAFPRIGLASCLCASWGCFTDAPGLDDDESSSGGHESTMGDSASGSPTTDPDDSGSGLDGTVATCGDGLVEGNEICDDGNATDDDGCQSDCRPSSGSPHWTVVEDVELWSGFYGVGVDATGNAVAVGFLSAESEQSDPWVVAYDGEGQQLWQVARSIGTGYDYYQFALPTDGDHSIAVGAFLGAGMYVTGTLDVYGQGGSVAVESEQDVGYESRLNAAAIGDDGQLLAVGSVAPDGLPHPFVAQYAQTGVGWEPNGTSEESGEYGDIVGDFRGVVRNDDGRFIACGYTIPEPDQPRQAFVVVLDEDGSMLDQAILGEDGEDDIVEVVVENGVVHALGRRNGLGATSQLWLGRLTIGDSIVVDWEATWSDLAYNVGNGLAVRDGVRYIAATTGASDEGPDYDSRVLRWDADEEQPTWVVPFEESSPGTDSAGDIAVAPDGTIVVAGAMTLPGTDRFGAWLRKLEP